MITLTNRVKKLENKITLRETWLQSGQHKGYQLSEEEWADAIQVLIECGRAREVGKLMDSA